MILKSALALLTDYYVSQETRHRKIESVESICVEQEVLYAGRFAAAKKTHFSSHFTPSHISFPASCYLN